MSIPFEFYANPTTDAKAERRYHARVVSKGSVSLRDIIDTVSGRCTLSAADIQATITALEEVVSEHLAQGYHVHLDGLGSFSLTLSSPEVTDPAKVRSPKIAVKSVGFKPDKSFVVHSQRFGFERSAVKPHSATLTLDEAKAALTSALATRPYVRSRDIAQLLGLTLSTAQRIAKTLHAEGFLGNLSQDARHPLYVLTGKL